MVVAIHTNGRTSKWSGAVVGGRRRMGTGVICPSRMVIIRSRRGECSMNCVRGGIDSRRGSKGMRMKYVSFVDLNVGGHYCDDLMSPGSCLFLCLLETRNGYSLM